MKHYKDLSVNSQAVNDQLNNITHKHNQTVQDLQSSTQRLLVINVSSWCVYQFIHLHVVYGQRVFTNNT